MNYAIASALDLPMRIQVARLYYRMGVFTKAQFIYQLGQLHEEAILGRKYGKAEV